jgi:hypothetical protein
MRGGGTGLARSQGGFHGVLGIRVRLGVTGDVLVFVVGAHSANCG